MHECVLIILYIVFQYYPWIHIAVFVIVVDDVVVDVYNRHNTRQSEFYSAFVETRKQHKHKTNDTHTRTHDDNRINTANKATILNT